VESLIVFSLNAWQMFRATCAALVGTHTTNRCESKLALSLISDLYIYWFAIHYQLLGLVTCFIMMYNNTSNNIRLKLIQTHQKRKNFFW